MPEIFIQYKKLQYPSYSYLLLKICQVDVTSVEMWKTVLTASAAALLLLFLLRSGGLGVEDA